MDLTGQTIAGKFLILEKLTRDNPGMSWVYRAQELALKRAVVIKVLHPDMARRPGIVQRFERESLALGKLRHPNIIAVHDTGILEGLPYIVLEYLEGGSLAALIANAGALTPERIAQIMAQIGTGLDHMHAHGMVHRDLKPANILFNAVNQPVVTDLGLVKIDGQPITEPGTLMGTPEYMAPEQIQGGPVGPWTDSYALAVIAYEALTGHKPFRGTSSAAVREAQVGQAPPSLRLFNADLPEPVERVILKGLSKTPGERFQSAGAFATALNHARRTSTRPPVSKTTPPRAATSTGSAPASRPGTSNTKRPSTLRRPSGVRSTPTPAPIAPRTNKAPTGAPVASGATSRRGALVAVLLLIMMLGTTGVYFGGPALAALLPEQAVAGVVSPTIVRATPDQSATSAAAATTRATARAERVAVQSPTAARKITATPTVEQQLRLVSVNPTAIFTGTLPLTLTVQGENLEQVEQARLVASGRASVLLAVQRPAAPDALMLQLAELPEALGGQVIYTLQIDNRLLPEHSVMLRDYSERKTVQGILDQHQCTTRVVVEGGTAQTRLRSEAQVESERLEVLRNGDQIDILRADVENWYQLRISGTPDGTRVGHVGWIERWIVDNAGVPPCPTAAPVVRGVVIPDVFGQDVGRARAFLQGLGFLVDVAPGAPEHVASVCNGQVAFSSPAKGTQVPAGTRVRLFYRDFNLPNNPGC